MANIQSNSYCLSCGININFECILQCSSSKMEYPAMKEETTILRHCQTLQEYARNNAKAFPSA